jgi:hypothetical protein
MASLSINECVCLILSAYLSICLSVYLPLCLSVCLSLSICLSVYLSICLSTYLSICLLVCLSVYLSVDPSIYLSGSGYGPVASSCEGGNGLAGSINCWEIVAEQLLTFQEGLSCVELVASVS